MSAPVQNCQPKGDDLFAIEKVLRFHTHSARIFDESNDTVIVTRTLLNNAADRIEELENRVEYLQASEANQIATLKARAEQAERAVDVLESNARVQAKLLADTGRRVEEMEGALREIESAISGWERIMCLPSAKEVKAIWNIARAALSSGEAGK